MWIGAFTSTTGTWMQMVAESWLVLSLTGSAFYLGLTGFLGELPMILFSLVGGVVADRVERRKMLLGSQYVQMTCAFILTVLVYFGWVRIHHLLILVFIVGTARSFGAPAYQALIPNLVNRETLANAIALNSIQFNLARVLGPLLAGLALASCRRHALLRAQRPFFSGRDCQPLHDPVVFPSGADDRLRLVRHAKRL